MTNPRRFFWMLLPGSLLATGCFGEGLRGNNQPSDEVRSVQGFTAIESDSSLDVLVQQGNAFRVEVRVDANLAPFVTTRLVGNALVIDTTKAIAPRLHGPHVIVTLPKLDRVELLGSGDMSIKGIESAEAMDMELSGSGDATFEGKVPDLKVGVTGSGDAFLSGSVNGIAVDASGSGDIHGKGLAASHASADSSGAGDISLNVVGPVDLAMAGSGDVELFGSPKLGRYDNTGSGDLTITDR